MKELVKNSKILELSALGDRLSAVVWYFVSAVLGFFMARTVLWGNMLPLGIALSTGVPIKLMPFCSLGVLVGYAIPIDEVSGFRYAAALLAVVAIRYIISGMKPVARNPLWSAVIATTVMSGVGIASAGTELLTKGAMGIAEGLLSGGGAYFIQRATSIKSFKTSMSVEQTASVLIAVNLGLAAFFPIAIDGISLGVIAAIVLILLAAKYGRVSTAAVCSIATASAIIFSKGDTHLAVTVCFFGLLSGVLASLGKIPSACGPAMVSAIRVLIQQGAGGSAASLAEAVIAGIVFLVIPKTAGVRIGMLIAPPVSTPDMAGLRKTLTMRLSFASAALHGVSDTVDDVSRCLAITKKPSFTGVLHDVENNACKGCSFVVYCWEKNRKATVDAALVMSEAVRCCQPIRESELPSSFADKCLRPDRFETSLVKAYTDYLSRVSAEKRVTEMREVVSDQMNGIADMLEELSAEFRTAQTYDVVMAGRVASALKELDLRADECSCVVDKYGRMTVEVKLTEPPEIPINRARILDRLEEVCERDFEPPEINKVGRKYYITATEKAVFSVDCFCTQFNMGDNQLCGDTCKYFFDGRGRLVVIVSDGMGSGGRAAVDSAMTAGLTERLLKAGFGYDCTLKLVNSAMLFKSTDESMATLDISCIDLFSGKTDLLKAGAAPTLVRRSGRTGRAECKSLPAGILNDVGFDRARVTLKENDILLMMSDGVCSDGTDWICAEIEAWEGAGARQLSERIASAARRRRHDGHDDDITVFAAILEKAV